MAVGGAGVGVAVGGAGVCVCVAVGGTVVGVGGAGVEVGAGVGVARGTLHADKANATSVKPTIGRDLKGFIAYFSLCVPRYWTRQRCS